MNEIDDAIGRVEILYRSLTGRDAPPADVPYAPIPAEHDPAIHVQDQMERLMRLIGASSQEPPTAAASMWTPTMSVWEGEHEFLVGIDLPGVTRDQLEVGLHGSLVIVTGKRLPPDGAPDAPRLRARGTEQPFGAFRRVIALPPTAQREHMTAWLKDGVLWLRAPNEAAVPPRNITIS
jgi:HSP20 family protein